MENALFHTNLEGIQILAYSKGCEVADSERRIQLAIASNGLDIGFSMGVVLARDFARALQVAVKSVYRPDRDRYEDRCLEFFGLIQGGVVSRDNKADPSNSLDSIQVAFSGDVQSGRPRVNLALTAGKAAALRAALLSACDAIISESAPQFGCAGAIETRVEPILSDWPEEISAIQEAKRRRAQNALADDSPRGNNSLSEALRT